MVAGAAAGSIAQAGILAQGRLALYCGGDEKVSTQRPVRLVWIGPRVTPSQRSHPMPQPFAARRTASQTTWAAVGYGGGGRPARPAENGGCHIPYCGVGGGNVAQNQKHAWPLEPLRLRGSVLPASGKGHQPVNGSPPSLVVGTLPFQGEIFPSTALRGRGLVMAPWPRATAHSAAAEHRAAAAQTAARRGGAAVVVGIKAWTRK
eukprot:SAG25_NODE_5170_length_693_cov_1.296296_1_plen_204_part_10